MKAPTREAEAIPVFGQSGRTKLPRPGRPATRSGHKGLLLAYFYYFSIRCARSPGAELRWILIKIVPGTPRMVNAEKAQRRLLSASTRLLPDALLLRRRNGGKGLKRLMISSKASGVRPRPRASQFALHTCAVSLSDAPVIGAPVLNRLLDVGPGKILTERPLTQPGQFCIGGEAQADKLSFG